MFTTIGHRHALLIKVLLLLSGIHPHPGPITRSQSSLLENTIHGQPTAPPTQLAADAAHAPVQPQRTAADAAQPHSQIRRGKPAHKQKQQPTQPSARQQGSIIVLHEGKFRMCYQICSSLHSTSAVQQSRLQSEEAGPGTTYEFGNIIRSGNPLGVNKRTNADNIHKQMDSVNKRANADNIHDQMDSECKKKGKSIDIAQEANNMRFPN